MDALVGKELGVEDRVSKSWKPSQYWMLGSLALLIVVFIYDHSLDPMVRALGLAHAKAIDQAGARILVVDSVGSADAPVLQKLFGGTIWGRQGFRVDLVLLPFLALVAAMAGFCFQLSNHLAAWGRQFFHLERGSALPTMTMWVAFLAGGCAATFFDRGSGLFALAVLPFGVSIFIVGAVVALAPFQERVWAWAFRFVSDTRWFWLGYLVLSPQGLFWDEGGRRNTWLAPTPYELLVFIFCLGFLYWASGEPEVLDSFRLGNPGSGIRKEYSRHSLLCVQELWLLLPVAAMAAAVGQLRLSVLCGYLMGLGVGALVFKWGVELPFSLELRSWFVRGTRFFFVLSALGVTYWRVFPFMGRGIALSLGMALMGILLVGLKARPSSTAVEDDTKGALHGGITRVPLSRSWWIGLVGLVVLAMATVGWSYMVGRGEEASILSTQKELSQRFGYRARIVESRGRTSVIGCYLDLAQQNQAVTLVSSRLSRTPVTIVSVITRHWERVARVVLALMMAAFLTVPTYLFTLGRPGSASKGYVFVLSLLGGTNGAFALGGIWGWFWLNPAPHLVAFLMGAGLVWLGHGEARAWVDGWIQTSKST